MNKKTETPGEVEFLYDLDAGRFAGGAITDIQEAAIPNLAVTYTAEVGFKPLLEKVWGWVVDVRNSYAIKVGEVFHDLAGKVAESLERFKELEPAQKLKDGFRAILAHKAVLYCQVRDNLEPARKKLRRMNIGLTGNPERGINVESITLTLLVLGLYSAIALAMEFRLNMPVLQGSTSREISGLISLILGIATITGVIFAASKRQERELHENANIELERYYADKPSGRDPVLGEIARVFPLSAGHSFRYQMSHIIAFGVPVLLIVMRTFVIYSQPHPNWWGGISGSLAFFILAVVVYVLKIHLPGSPETSRVNEYRDAKKEVSELEKSMVVLQNPLATTGDGTGLVASWSLYNDTMKVFEDSNQTSEVSALIARLEDQVKASGEYFTQALTTSAVALANAVKEEHGVEVPLEEMESIPVLADINLSVLEETKKNALQFQRIMEWHTLAREIWREVLSNHEKEIAERKKVSVEAEKEERARRAARIIDGYTPSTGGVK